MIKGISKFDHDYFYSDFGEYAFNKQKYSEQQAVQLFRVENGCPDSDIAVCDAFVIHRAGINDDNEPIVGWWLEYEDKGRSCPVYAMHIKDNNFDYSEFKEYRFHTVNS